MVDFRSYVSSSERSSYAVVQRFAVSARFFRAVQYGNLLNRIGNSCQEVFFRPRTEHVNVDTADFFALFNEQFNRFFNGLCAGTHSDENEFSIGSTGVVEEMVFTTGDFADFLHVAFRNFRNAVVEFVQGFTMLHKDFSRFAEGNSFRIIRVHAAFTEFTNGIHIEKRTEFFIRNNFDFLDFVRRTETIEEVNDRDTTGNSRCMDDSSQVHDFLNAGFTHHADTSTAHSHGIVVTGKNRIPVGSNGTRSDVEDARQQFAGNFEHITEHDHHALRGRESRRKGTGIQSTVHRTGSTFFRLHFLNLDGRAKQVLTAMSSPFIDVFSHRR